MPMEPDEIRVEVARRRQRARDLKIRENLWELESSFRGYRIWQRDDPQFAAQLVYPGVELSNDEAKFSLGQSTYQLSYRRGKTTSETFSGTEFTTIHGTLALKVNDEKVFKFELAETTEYGPEMPSFHDSLGEITRYTDGPWVNEIADFLPTLRAHVQRVWKERNAPREAKEAEDLKRRFGL
jgi:hypothetical protein